MIYGANTCSPSTPLHSVGGKKKKLPSLRSIKKLLEPALALENLERVLQSMLTYGLQEWLCWGTGQVYLLHSFKVSSICGFSKLSSYISAQCHIVSIYVESLKYSVTVFGVKRKIRVSFHIYELNTSSNVDEICRQTRWMLLSVMHTITNSQLFKGA